MWHNEDLEWDFKWRCVLSVAEMVLLDDMKKDVTAFQLTWGTCDYGGGVLIRMVIFQSDPLIRVSWALYLMMIVISTSWCCPRLCHLTCAPLGGR